MIKYIFLLIPIFAKSQTFTITQPGTYTGRYISKDGSPAVVIATSGNAIVTLKNSYIESNGDDAVMVNGYQQIVFDHDSVIAKVNVNGNHQAKLIHTYKPRYFKAQYCYFENGYPILLQENDETAANTHTFIVTNNIFKNSNKSKPDGSGDGADHSHAVMMDGLQNVTKGEIGWNQCINEPGKSWVEDIINIHNSTGTAKTPIWIHDNYLYGAYPLDTHANYYSGSGITCEQGSKYVIAERNQVLSCMNGCMNITGSDSIVYRNNTMISASILPDGYQSSLFWAACSIFDGSRYLQGDSIINNKIGYVRWNDAGNKYPYPGRHDENNIRTMVQNQMPPGLNFYLPNAPILKATEDSEYTSWLKKLKDSSQYVGVVAPLVAVTVDSVSLVEGNTKTGSIQPIDKNGLSTGYLLNTIIYSSSDTSIFRIAKNADEKTFTITANKPGKATAMVRLTSKYGTIVSKSFSVTVIPKEPEAVDLKIIFN